MPDARMEALRTHAARLLTKNRRGLIVVAGGTAVGQVLALAASPFLTRLFSPADFGIYTIVCAFVAILGTVAGLRFELAVPLPQNDEDGHALVALSMLCASIFAVIGTAIFSTASVAIASLFQERTLRPWLPFVPCLAAMMSIYLSLVQLAIRQQRYRSIGWRNAAQSAAMILGQIATGVERMRAGGLILGFGFGQAVGTVSLLAGSRLFSVEARAGRNRQNLKRVLVRYRRFPLLLAPSGLLNILGLQLPVLLVAYWYGSQIAGWLGLTQRVMALPVALVGTAVAQVYLGELSRAIRTDVESALRLFWKATRSLATTAVILLLVLLIAGPWSFSLAFGAKWLVSGQFAQALAPALAAQLVAAPLSQTLITLERHVLQLAWDFLRVFSTVAAVALSAALRLSALTAVWSISVVSVLLYAISWALSRQALAHAGATTSY